MDVLDLRRLNRATLARQGLDQRRSIGVAELVRLVGGIQAQQPGPMATGLWSRIRDFDRVDLRAAVAAGQVVRGTTLRGTLHLHAVDDYRAVRMPVQPGLDVFVRGLAKRLGDLDVSAVVAAGEALLSDGPQTIKDLKRTLVDRFPGVAPQSLGNLVWASLQVLRVPDLDAPECWAHVAPLALATSLVGDTLEPGPNPELLVRRFLEVMGPGSPQDAQVWCGQRGLKPVMQRMHDAGELDMIMTWEGDELYDLPGAPRPDDSIVVPPRFLPMWDNVLLSHADRSRVVDPAFKPYLASRNGMPPPTYLIDGFVHGTWRVERTKDDALLMLSPFAEIPSRHEAALIAEGESLLRFLERGATRVEVRVGS